MIKRCQTMCGATAAILLAFVQMPANAKGLAGSQNKIHAPPPKSQFPIPKAHINFGSRPNVPTKNLIPCSAFAQGYAPAFAPKKSESPTVADLDTALLPDCYYDRKAVSQDVLATAKKDEASLAQASVAQPSPALARPGQEDGIVSQDTDSLSDSKRSQDRGNILARFMSAFMAMFQGGKNSAEEDKAEVATKLNSAMASVQLRPQGSFRRSEPVKSDSDRASGFTPLFASAYAPAFGSARVQKASARNAAYIPASAGAQGRSAAGPPVAERNVASLSDSSSKMVPTTAFAPLYAPAYAPAFGSAPPTPRQDNIPEKRPEDKMARASKGTDLQKEEYPHKNTYLEAAKQKERGYKEMERREREAAGRINSNRNGVSGYSSAYAPTFAARAQVMNLDAAQTDQTFPNDMNIIVVTLIGLSAVSFAVLRSRRRRASITFVEPLLADSR